MLVMVGRRLLDEWQRKKKGELGEVGRKCIMVGNVEESQQLDFANGWNKARCKWYTMILRRRRSIVLQNDKASTTQSSPPLGAPWLSAIPHPQPLALHHSLQ